MGNRAETKGEKFLKNNERPETLSSSGRPGSPPPELLTKQNKSSPEFCLWHFRAISAQEEPALHPPDNE
jgi:hypothetical protein